MNHNTDTLLIFDCDGVLVDSEPLANRTMIQCLQNEDFDVDDRYAIEHFHGIADKDCVAHIEAVFRRKVSDKFLETLAVLTEEEIKNTLQPIPNIREALASLPYTKCVASGSEPEKIELSLQVTGLKSFFGHVYSSSQVQRGKPYPDVFLFAAKEMGFAPNQCIVIEDSRPGVQAGLSAGMKVLQYRPTSENDAKLPEAGVEI